MCRFLLFNKTYQINVLDILLKSMKGGLVVLLSLLLLKLSLKWAPPVEEMWPFLYCGLLCFRLKAAQAHNRNFRCKIFWCTFVFPRRCKMNPERRPFVSPLFSSSFFWHGRELASVCVLGKRYIVHWAGTRGSPLVCVWRKSVNIQGRTLEPPRTRTQLALSFSLFVLICFPAKIKKNFIM